jgi:acylphosphatase
MAEKTIHAVIEGRVQGVYFRDCTRREAEKLGLCGWVRNLPNGAVEALIIGENDSVDQMVTWLHRGSPKAIVSRVITTERAGTEEFSEFAIRY